MTRFARHRPRWPWPRVRLPDPSRAPSLPGNELARLREHAGLTLSPPVDGLKGVYLVNGTRLDAYALIARQLRSEYATCLTHWWELDRRRLREYRALAPYFDAVASPSEEWDRVLSFAPIVRSNSSDLWVDDAMWPDLGLERDLEVVESVSVPWVHKRPLVWLTEVQALLDRLGGGGAVYMTKREPNEKEDARCHREYERFRELVAEDPRIELLVRSPLETVVRTYNRAKRLYHPASSDFGPRCITEALYCGCIVVLGRFPWVSTATASPEVWKRIVVQDGLLPAPEYSEGDVRRWRTAQAARTHLLDVLEAKQPVNRDIESFTMFSSKRVGSSEGGT
jgi:glycosyltransferase involved in cell wall biosynthesis